MKKILLTAFTACSLMAQAQQVPNSSFETWETDTFSLGFVTLTYEQPADWFTSNLGALLSAEKPVTKSSDKVTGNYSMLLNNVVVQGEEGKDTIPGFALTGFEVNSYPTMLRGFYKANIQAQGDTINIMAMAGNSDDTTHAAIASLSITASQSTFKEFTVPFYGNLAQNPDSVLIIISTGRDGRATPGTSLTIDDLKIDFTTLSLAGSASGNTNISVFPSPAAEEVNIASNNPSAEHYTVKDTDGHVVFEGRLSYKEPISLDLTNQSSGIYFVEISDRNHNRINTIKFIKN